MNIKVLIGAVILTYTAGVTAGDFTPTKYSGIYQDAPLQVASINDDYFRFTAINNFFDAELISKLVNEEKHPHDVNRDLQPIELQNNGPKMENRDEPRFDKDQN